MEIDFGHKVSENLGVNKMFEELDYCKTKLGALSLRRRKVPLLEDRVVYEVILNDEFLMSSLFHVTEDGLADLGLEAVTDSNSLDVVVGGLGILPCRGSRDILSQSFNGRKLLGHGLCSP